MTTPVTRNPQGQVKSIRWLRPFFLEEFHNRRFSERCFYQSCFSLKKDVFFKFLYPVHYFRVQRLSVIGNSPTCVLHHLRVPLPSGLRNLLLSVDFAVRGAQVRLKRIIIKLIDVLLKWNINGYQIISFCYSFITLSL